MKYFSEVCGLVLKLMLILLFIPISFFKCASEKNSTEPEQKGPIVVASPQPQLYFGQIPAAQENEAYRECKLSNAGEQALVVPGLVIEGTDADLFTLEDSGRIELRAGESKIIGVTFHPQTNGTFTAQMKIESNASTSPDYYDLTGKGTTTVGRTITFERIIGSMENDGASSVRITNDGGYIVAGNTAHPSEDGTVATLTRLDRYGNFLWQEIFSGDGTSSFTSVVLDENDQIIAVGRTASIGSSNNNIYLVKTDADGQFPIENTYGGTMNDNASAIEKTSDGGYIIAGKTNNTEAAGGLQDALLLKLSSNLTEEWTRLYGNEEGEDARGIKQTSDGGYVFAGAQSKGEFQDVYLVKTQADGTLEWEKNFGVPNDLDAANDIIISEDGGFVLAGFTTILATDIYVIKTDPSGNELWSKTYGESGNNEATAIIQTGDSGYLIVGSSPGLESQGRDVHIIKTDGSGNQEWQQMHGGKGGDSASCVRQDIPEGFIISGNTASFSTSSEMYILKVDANGLIGP